MPQPWRAFNLLMMQGMLAGPPHELMAAATPTAHSAFLMMLHLDMILSSCSSSAMRSRTWAGASGRHWAAHEVMFLKAPLQLLLWRVSVTLIFRAQVFKRTPR